MPFGMVQFSPDTNSRTTAAGDNTANRNGSVYRWNNRVTRGFSMTHASQGCSLYGDIPIIPSTSGNLTATSTNDAPWNQGLIWAKDTNQPTIDPAIEYGEVGY